MAKYFDKEVLKVLSEAGKKIVDIRNSVTQQTGIDILDTDAISSLAIYEIVSQYDNNYNINFARNGEDAKSLDILIEQKATRVAGPLTKTGKPRKHAGSDACFQFHAMGDLDHPRYIFACRNKDTLALMRIYDISSESNKKIILDYLMSERELWLERGKTDAKLMKRDLILLSEKFIQENCNLTNKLKINECIIYKD